MNPPSQRRKGEERTYRRLAMVDRLITFHVSAQQTDLMVMAQKDLRDICREEVLAQRGYIEQYIKRFPQFRTTLDPWLHDAPAPGIIHMMAAAGRACGVGPMAAVAGAIAETVGQALHHYSREVIIENGGDVFMVLDSAVTIGLYAGQSPLSMRIGLQLDPGGSPLAVCTSSGTVGHSFSRGKADAVCIVARQCALADAAATAIANRVASRDVISEAIHHARSIDGVEGVVAICGERMGLWGDLHIVKIDGAKKA